MTLNLNMNLHFYAAQKLFSTMKVVGMSELNLSANQWKDEMRRFEWTPQTGRQRLLSPSPFKIPFVPFHVHMQLKSTVSSLQQLTNYI